VLLAVVAVLDQYHHLALGQLSEGVVAGKHGRPVGRTVTYGPVTWAPKRRFLCGWTRRVLAGRGGAALSGARTPTKAGTARAGPAADAAAQAGSRAAANHRRLRSVFIDKWEGSQDNAETDRKRKRLPARLY
jgi:hypothetical protein